MRSMMLGLVALLVLASATPAYSDGTLFFGGITAGAVRPTADVAIGVVRSVGGFELDYAQTTGAGTLARHSIGTFGVNLVLQTPPRANGLQFLGFVGFGLYGETTGIGGPGSGEVLYKTIGGGTKVPLAGPLKVRLDYRVVLPGEAGDASAGFTVQHHLQRISVGITAVF